MTAAMETSLDAVVDGYGLLESATGQQESAHFDTFCGNVINYNQGR